MKTLILVMTLSVTALFFVLPRPVHVEPNHCMVQFDTSRGPSSFNLEARFIDGIYSGTREDRTQKPNWCFWKICSYPRVESSWIMTRDLTSYHVQDTVAAAEAKVQTCKPNFHVNH